MKRTEIKILSLIVSAIFSAVIVPAGLSAQEGGVEGLHTNKNSTYDNSTHQGKITLETFVEGEVKVKTQSSPCDIVMVLDFSASMANRIDDLKTSCLSFLDAMRKNNPEHRVAIVSYNKCEFTRIGWSSNEDGTVVWPQNPKMSSLSGYDQYGNTNSGNKINRSANPNRTQQLYDHVKNLNWFIPLNDELPTEGNVADYIVSHFVASDCGDDGNSYRGLQVANELLFTKRTNTDNNGTPRPTFVVLFTDGAPGFEPKSGETLNFSDEYLSICYAINAIGEANQLKSKNTTIFTVGINKNCNPEYDGDIKDEYSYTPPHYELKPAEGAFNAYLSLLSSNFIGDPIHTASDIDKGTSKEIGGKSMDYDDIIEARLLIWNKRKNSPDSAKFNFDVQHYLGATQSSGMEAAFETISERIIEELPSMPLTSETVLKDYINKTFFKLPKDATIDDIVVYTRPFSGMSGSDFVFGAANPPLTVLGRPLEESEIGSCVRVIIDWAEEGDNNSQDCVSVTGFDYAANWVGFDVNKQARGCELVVEIPFVFKDGVELDGDLDTNTGNSGIYTPDNPDEPVEPYPVPKLSFKDLTITRSNLESGESAIYNVYSVNQDKLVYTVVLTGTTSDGSETASKTITGVLARDSEGNYYGYEVTESDWDWAYNKDVNNNSKTSAYTDDSDRLEFAFKGAHKEETLGSDAYKQHHTEVKTSDRISKTN